MIKTWDVRTGTSLYTLTHHKKGVRALIVHPTEYTFASGAADKIRIWKCPEGHHLRTMAGHNSIINSMALNRDNVLVSGSDNGVLSLYDWDSGHMFQ